MHVYISVDMEGVAGIATTDQVARGGTGYSRAQELMTAETNAAIAGAFDGGATVVTVNDSHGTMDNLLHDQLDDRASVIFGAPKAQCMAQGLDDRHDVAFFVGYHAAAGEDGVLAHSFSSFFSEFRLNGSTMSEAQVNALYAASHGVPVGLVTGDRSICAVAEAEFAGVLAVPVKSAEGWTATNSLHPRVACQMIRAGAAAAVRRADVLKPVQVPDRLTLEVTMQIPTAAELAAMVPGARQTGQFSAACELADPRELLGLVSVWYSLAAGAMRGRLPLVLR